MMKTVRLPGSDRMTTQLGFGCAFQPKTTEVQAHRVLQAAYDAGIRHFDVAPFYLDGRAEGYVGTFLEGRDDVTVTSKYGLRPPSARPLHIRAARTVLGPAVRALRARRPSPSGAPPRGPRTAKASYRPGEARESLTRSLGLLRRDKLDLYLMHEPDAADLGRAGLLEFLETEAAAGHIGAFGVGGHVLLLSEAYTGHREFFGVAQFNHDALTNGPRFRDAFEIHYWVLTQDFRGLVRHLIAHPEAAQRLSDSIGLDVGDPRVLSRLMLKAALLDNPNGLVLIASTDPERIRQNAEVAADDSLAAPAARLIEAGASRVGGFELAA
ncbi:MAG TPA: aldo/keto reductase [Phenylobacterium sp.]|uniref:aldo/keto reductase n=1 Tax=Phenylobacterium sp. TaxID=1871053 RepID=UPI002CC4DE81|nr:aldo/keto reductase [Phenylobacterium sp.]HSV02430.1 aldo/keto reductase [Phenylobacterium sp.]